jgi:tetratricopeptide (TPR) repeat protein
MRRSELVLLVGLASACLAGAEEPPYKRVLQGDDAMKAAALQKRIDELWAAGKFAEARARAEQLRDLRRRVQGDKQWEAADAARLVETLRQAASLPAAKQADLAKAPATNAKAIKLYERGKHVEAEALFRQAVAVREEALGPRHPDTALSYNNLALNLDAQGRAREAEPLHRKALAIKEEVLGPKHPDTALGCNNLALNLAAQGRAKEAEPLFRRALAVFEEVLGPKHPDTATGYHNLAYNLHNQGRVQGAEMLLRRALAIKEEVLGPNHPDTAQSYNSLAGNLQAQGRAQEAEPLYRRAGAVFEEVLGPRHPLTATSYNNLAMDLQDQGRAQEAEPLLRQALAIREEVLRRKHPDTAMSYNNLATNVGNQGRAKEAEPLFRKALAIREEVLGPRHPRTAQSYNNLAANLQDQGRAPEAEPLFRRALLMREEVFGPRHPDTAQSYHNLAGNLTAQGRDMEAEPLLRQALAVHEEVLGRKHPNTARTYNNLAANLQAQGRAKEAEPLWLKGAEALEAARLRLAVSAVDKAAASRIQPHVGWAACRARLGRPGDAWAAAEAGLARGLLDELAARSALPADPKALLQDRQRAARLGALERLLTPLLSREKLAEADQRRRDALLQERQALDDEVARAAAERSRKAILPLAEVQAALAADAALVFWVDYARLGDHWGCVLRHRGPPAWVRLPGSGAEDAWTAADHTLPRRLRADLDRGEPEATRRSRRLARQRLDPLAPHLAATDELPEVRHLIVVPVGPMAGVPVEVLTDRYLVSYAPSGTVFARLRQKHRPLASPTLLALGDPNFAGPGSDPPPQPPEYGLYLSLVLPGSNAARAGLRGGDVLLRYGGRKLTTKNDLQLSQSGDAVPVSAWRDGHTLDDLPVEAGKLGIVISEDPPAVALRKRRDLELVADARVRDSARPLPGTRLEVAALAALLPKHRATLLLGSKASEQELDQLATAGRLKQYRLVHLATHGSVDPASAAHSALLLARDRLPGPEEQAKLAAAGKKVPTGRLTVGDIADRWELDTDLVVLSACQTALGPSGGGEGLLGFSQVLLAKGARSLVLSLWKVDDTATALLMHHFYQNLLGKRDGLDRLLPKAQALHEAKRWLRTLPRAEAEGLAGRLAKGAVRADEEEAAPPRVATAPAVPAGDAPFAHPRFWAAFILIGDPE